MRALLILAVATAVSAADLSHNDHGNNDGSSSDATAGNDGLSNSEYLYWRGWHVALMVVSWGLLLPAGALFAVPVGKFVAPRRWLAMHVGCQLAGTVLSTAGFVIGLAKIGSGAHLWHFITGQAVMILLWIQTLGGVMRAPAGESVQRRAWLKAHRNLGFPIILLGSYLQFMLGIRIVTTSFAIFCLPSVALVLVLALRHLALRCVQTRYAPVSLEPTSDRPEDATTQDSAEPKIELRNVADPAAPLAPPARDVSAQESTGGMMQVPVNTVAGPINTFVPTPELISRIAKEAFPERDYRAALLIASSLVPPVSSNL